MPEWRKPYLKFFDLKFCISKWSRWVKHPQILSYYCLRKCRVWRGPLANKRQNCKWLPEVLAETDTRVRFLVGFRSIVSNGQSLGVYNHTGTDCRESGKNNEKNVNSNSNLSEGHIPNKKCSAGHSLLEKLLRTEIYKKSSQNKLNLIKIYNSSIFGDVHGPHKFIWRATSGAWAACLRPLCLYVLVNYFLGLLILTSFGRDRRFPSFFRHYESCQSKSWPSERCTNDNIQNWLKSEGWTGVEQIAMLKMIRKY